MGQRLMMIDSSKLVNKPTPAYQSPLKRLAEEQRKRKIEREVFRKGRNRKEQRAYERAVRRAIRRRDRS